MVTKEKSREYNRRWSKKNPEKKRALQKRYNQKLKIDVFSHYSKKGKPVCHCCGEKHIEFLTLDHINLDGSKHRAEFKKRRTKGGSMSGNKFYRWLRKNNYPKNIKIQILCFNCNCARQYSKICPHEKD